MNWLPGLQAAKAALYREFMDAGLRKSDLARHLRLAIQR